MQTDDAVTTLLGRLGDEAIDLTDRVDADHLADILRRDRHQIRVMPRRQHMTAMTLATGRRAGLALGGATQHAGDHRIGQLMLAKPRRPAEHHRMRQATVVVHRGEVLPQRMLPRQRREARKRDTTADV